MNSSSHEWQFFVSNDARIIAVRLVAGEPVFLDVSWNGSKWHPTDLTIRSSALNEDIRTLEPLVQAMRVTVEDGGATRH